MAEPYGPGNYPPQNVVDGASEPSMTQQSFAQEADINYIIGKYVQAGYLADGVIPDNSTWNKAGDSGDLEGGVGIAGMTGSEARDLSFSLFGELTFADMMLRVKQAEMAFMTLPADIRYRFDNQPNKMIEFLQNPANADEAKSLFYVTVAPVPAP